MKLLVVGYCEAGLAVITIESNKTSASILSDTSVSSNLRVAEPEVEGVKEKEADRHLLLGALRMPVVTDSEPREIEALMRWLSLWLPA